MEPYIAGLLPFLVFVLIVIIVIIAGSSRYHKPRYYPSKPSKPSKPSRRCPPSTTPIPSESPRPMPSVPYEPSPTPTPYVPPTPMPTPIDSQNNQILVNLWNTQAIYNRLLLMAVIDDTEDINHIVTKLHENARSIGQIFEYSYGETTAADIISVLNKNTEISVSLLKEMNNEPTEIGKELAYEWISNYYNLVSLLSKLSPKYTVDDWSRAFEDYTQYFTFQGEQYAQKQYEEDSQNFNKYMLASSTIGDMMGKIV